jgi:hypothetical protein
MMIYYLSVFFLQLVIYEVCGYPLKPRFRISQLKSSATDLESNISKNIGLMISPSDLNLATLGMPRVIEKFDSDDSIAYLMWIEGREPGFDAKNELPKLSNGRIFFLSSPDGIKNWTLHDDNPIVNPNKLEKGGDWWMFDSEHVGLGDVVTPGGTSQSKFITQDGVYLMYTYGGNADSVTLEDKTIKGARMEIGVCVSQDGVNWSRVEGPNPHGSILEPGKRTDFDGHMIGWPSVIDFDDYRMYYHTYYPHDQKFLIGSAKSTDGIKWTKSDKPVFSGGPEGTFDEKGASRRYITVDPCTGVFKMWYEGINNLGKHAIGLATSENGDEWKRYSDEPIFSPSMIDDAWDSDSVGSPHLLWLKDKRRWRLYYVGSKADDDVQSIGVAESTDEEGIHFERIV